MDIFTISGRNYDSNIYLILGDKPTIIDTGTGLYSTEVCSTLRQYTPLDSISQIILTHEHYDHVGGTPDIVKEGKGNANILAHKHAEDKLASGISSFARLLGGTMPKITIDVALQGEERLILGDESFRVLHTPGHSLGSISLYGEQSKSLFSGDTIFAFGDFGRYDLPGGDVHSLCSSIELLCRLDVESLYPGHGPTIETKGKDHIQKSYRNIQSLLS